MENLATVAHKPQPASAENSLSPGDTDDQQQARLAHWLAVTAADEEERRLYRRPHHEYEAALLRRPINPQDAYGQFGLLLGIIPPAALFYQMVTHIMRPMEIGGTIMLAALFLVMNVICALAGRATGRLLAKAAYETERFSFLPMLMILPLIGLTWGIITGFFGGLLFFGIGAIGGIFVAAPVGAIAFTIFGILHRWLERGSLIDRRLFLPIAYGISISMAAFFLGL